MGGAVTGGLLNVWTTLTLLTAVGVLAVLVGVAVLAPPPARPPPAARFAERACLPK